MMDMYNANTKKAGSNMLLLPEVKDLTGINPLGAPTAVAANFSRVRSVHGQQPLGSARLFIKDTMVCQLRASYCIERYEMIALIEEFCVLFGLSLKQLNHKLVFKDNPFKLFSPMPSGKWLLSNEIHFVFATELVATVCTMFMWTWVLLPIVTATSYCNLCDVDQDTPLKSLVDRAILSEATLKLSKIGYRESISTKPQALRFQMQSDGNLVLVDMDKLKPIWASMPKVKKVNAAYTTLESDGPLAVFVNNDNERPVWSTLSSAKASSPYCLVVSDNETRYGVSIYDSECTLLWRPSVASG